MEKLLNFIQDLFLKEKKPFTSKRDFNWKAIKVAGSVIVLGILFAILAHPESSPESIDVSEAVITGEKLKPVSGSAEETLEQFTAGHGGHAHVRSSLEYLYKADAPVAGGVKSATNQTSSMVVTREGLDVREQLPAGSKFVSRLIQNVSVFDQPVPVMGEVARDVSTDFGVAISAGSKLLGELSFEKESERTSLQWHAVILPDGRQRNLAALGTGKDGESTLEGTIKSEGVRNAIGQTLTRFVGAYAAGSINTGAFGAHPGGTRNGIRNAIAETANQQATTMGENLQRERKWFEMKKGSEFLSVLIQPFAYKDPGAFGDR